MTKKFVLKLEIQEDKDKRRAMKAVSTLPGIDEITIDVKGKQMTVVGTVDPISVVSKLRKRSWPTELISVGPAKEPEKKDEAKKEEAKKDDGKKEEAAKEEGKKEEPKKEEEKKEEPKKEEKKSEPELIIHRPPYYLHPINTTMYQRAPYYAPPVSNYYQPHHPSVEENPNGCVIS